MKGQFILSNTRINSYILHAFPTASKITQVLFRDPTNLLFSCIRWKKHPKVKFPPSPILLLNKSVFPMAMYCSCRCFLYPRTECIMKYGAVRKLYPPQYHSGNHIQGSFVKILPLQSLQLLFWLQKTSTSQL